MNKVGFLITRMGIGGSERVFCNLAKNLDKKKFKVVIICLYNPGPLAKELIGQDIKIYSSLMRDKKDIRGLFYLFRIFLKEKLEILFIPNQYLSQVIGVFVGRLSGVKKIIVRYTLQSPNHMIGFRELIRRITIFLVDRVICQSGGHKDYVVKRKKISPRKIDIIANGVVINRAGKNIDLNSKRKELDINKSTKIVGMVGTLRWQKGYRFFLEAASVILKNQPNTRFLIIGDGPERANLERFAKDIGIFKHIYFLGMREDVDELLSLFDVAVLSSVTECSPLAVLEYMAHSRPIVATQVGNIPELIIDGVTGFLVPPQDAGRLADRISTLLRDPELCLKFGSSAKERVMKYFSLEKMIERYEELFLNEAQMS